MPTWAHLLFLFVCASANVVMEVSFDLALQQESETGYTASHTVGDYLKDPNLLWLRYLNTLVSGAVGNAPMRTAFLEFKDYKSWASFEAVNMEKTHVLYDLFWINWRRVIWESDEALAIKGAARTEERPGGFMFVFRYSPKEGKSADTTKFWKDKLPTLSKELSGNDGFLESRHFSNGLWQDQYTNLVWFEFSTMESLSRAVYENPTLTRALEEAKDKYFARFSSSVMVPSAGSQGGRIFKGASQSA